MWSSIFFQMWKPFRQKENDDLGLGGVMEHVVPVLEVNVVLNEEIDDRGVGIFSPQNHHQELEQEVKKERKATSKEDVAKRQRVKIQA